MVACESPLTKEGNMMDRSPKIKDNGKRDGNGYGEREGRKKRKVFLVSYDALLIDKNYVFLMDQLHV